MLFVWIKTMVLSGLENMTSVQMNCSVGIPRGQKSLAGQKSFLKKILSDGGMAQKKIEEEAEKCGIKSKTLRNAKQELGIDAVKRGNQWFWILSE